MLTTVKLSKVTARWFASIKYLNMCEFIFFSLCSLTRSISLLPVSPLLRSIFIGHLTLWVKSWWCSFLVLSFSLNLVRGLEDTITYVKTDTNKHVLSILNSFHGNILFFYEQEIKGKIFLNILILRYSRPLYNTTPPITVSLFIGNHLHQIHGNEVQLEEL